MGVLGDNDLVGVVVLVEAVVAGEAAALDAIKDELLARFLPLPEPALAPLALPFCLVLAGETFATGIGDRGLTDILVGRPRILRGLGEVLLVPFLAFLPGVAFGGVAVALVVRLGEAFLVVVFEGAAAHANLAETFGWIAGAHVNGWVAGLFSVLVATKAAC